MSKPSLPPRESSRTSSISSINSDGGSSTGRLRSDTIHLTPHTQYPEHGKPGNSPYWGSTGLDDPRSSSTQSLRPIESAGANRRTLLLIYIHGFMGTETSFKSFPAHVHSLLTMTLAETHVVHTKIYPRYQSRKHISFARDAFSNWLQPHESDKTDVVLLGHSLGGILAAEVVLLPSHTPGSNKLFQHHILGQIAYDTPFLGMHPGVVSTGIASLFRGAPDPKEENAENENPSNSNFLSSLFEPQPSDPNFNPAYSNDVNLPVRKNKFDRAMYFWNKHSGELRKAAQSYVKSHLEFGGCLADYQGLHKRYNAVRPLEDVDELAGKKSQNGKLIPRVRFVNYYTASTGRIKEEPPIQPGQTLVAESEMTELVGSQPLSDDRSRSRSITPRISLEEHTADEVITKNLEELDIDEPEMTQLEPRPSTPSSNEGSQKGSIILTNSRTDTMSSKTAKSDSGTFVSSLQSSYGDLPSLPPTPTEPPSFDPNLYSDPDVLKLAQKDHERLVKAYEGDKKGREKAIKDRKKLVAKLEKNAEKERAKLIKQELLKEKQEMQQMEKEQEKIEKEKLKRQATLNQEAYDRQLRNEAVEHAESINNAGSKSKKKQRDRKFCSLPKKDSKTGQRDSTWIRVFMEGMDEVVAHTSLFIVGEAYAKLVGDTAARIEEWVHEDATRRILMSEQHG